MHGLVLMLCSTIEPHAVWEMAKADVARFTCRHGGNDLFPLLVEQNREIAEARLYRIKPRAAWDLSLREAHAESELRHRAWHNLAWFAYCVRHGRHECAQSYRHSLKRVIGDEAFFKGKMPAPLAEWEKFNGD